MPNLEAILWPGSYATAALQRADMLDHDLAELYRQGMGRRMLADNVSDPGLAIARGLDLSKHRRFLVDADPDLPLSIVTTTRNDDHVERMQERTQAFIDCLALLAERYATRTELIIVEWNPPADRPPLEAAFLFPESHPYLSVRIVTVPEQVHNRYIWADALPLYQMIAKNVGIRRARGRFVLATNIDVLLSDELFTYITSADRTSGAIYRSNRWDIDRNVLDFDAPGAMLAKARDLCFQVNYADGIWRRGAGEPVLVQPQGDFAGFLPAVHTMACGDFQMLHRDDWGKLAGYSELDAYSFHIDSLFAATCHFAGLREVRLGDDYPHYHIDHTLGTVVRSDTYVINEKKALKHLSMGALINLCLTMKNSGSYLMFNEAWWGLATDRLPESRPARAAWDVWNMAYPLLDGDAVPASAADLKAVNVDFSGVADRWLDEVATSYAAVIQRHFSGRSIQIWGAGNRGRVMAERLASHGIAVSAFIHGGAADGVVGIDLPVLPADAVECDGKHLILVASVSAEAIRAAIEAKGGKEGRDYLVLP